MRVIEGRIISSHLAQFGAMGIQYGTTSVETDSGSSVNVKVDAHTLHEEFATGDNVQIEMEELGKSAIWVARRIVNLRGHAAKVESEPADVSSSP